MSNKIHLVLGGSRSGKSSYAEKLAEEQERPVVYVATCRTEGLDEEMQTRVQVQYTNMQVKHCVCIHAGFQA